MLMFAHGFSVHFGTDEAARRRRRHDDRPKGPGHLVRRTYEEGIGTPALVAVQQDATGNALQRAPRLRRRRSAPPGPAIIETTFKEETETDLFGEQSVLCGGISTLVQAGFDTLVRGRLPARDRLLRVPARAEADHRPDLRGRPVVDALLDLRHGRVRRLPERTPGRRRGRPRTQMRQVLAEIQDGTFAEEWLAEADGRLPTLPRDCGARPARLELERVGRELRPMMPWLHSDEKVVPE